MSPFPHLRSLCLALLGAMSLSAGAQSGSTSAQAAASNPGLTPARSAAAESRIRDGREAWRKRDRARLSALKSTAIEQQDLLAPWLDYWDHQLRIKELTVADAEAFYQRWSGSYVEDRFRNDWLLELGQRQDWAAFSRDWPRFRMNDDAEVRCYGQWAKHQSGAPVREAALQAWWAQKEADEGCHGMASALFKDKVIQAPDVWRKMRLSMDAGKSKGVIQAADILGGHARRDIGEVIEQPQRYLRRQTEAIGPVHEELIALALMRAASQDPQQAAQWLSERWEAELPHHLAAWAWASTGRHAASKLLPQAKEYYAHAADLGMGRRLRKGSPGTAPVMDWSEDMLAWKVRAAIRAQDKDVAWPMVLEATSAMVAPQNQDPTWIYWRAMALRQTAAAQPERLAQAQTLFESVAEPLSFYGQLAIGALGRNLQWPAPPAALTGKEQQWATQHRGLSRALAMIDAGLRPEGVKEWNFSLRGMSDRELLAAAQRACDRELWDRCINTSDRTKAEFDLKQRYPTPFREDVLNRTTRIGLDAAFVYGLIRQESRFIVDAKSVVGAAGLMQIMPATAKWTAKKMGMAFTPDMIHRRDVNIAIGTDYLQRVLADLEGSQPMAAAAYNAGPGRPRRWREGPLMDSAAWIENIPFQETRDYAKKVTSNANVYAGLLGAADPHGMGSASLRQRIGRHIGPRKADLPQPDKELP